MKLEFLLLLRMQSMPVLLDVDDTFVLTLILERDRQRKQNWYTISSVQHPWFIPTSSSVKITTIVHRTRHLHMSLCEKNVFIPIDPCFVWLYSNFELSVERINLLLLFLNDALSSGSFRYYYEITRGKELIQVELLWEDYRSSTWPLRDML